MSTCRNQLMKDGKPYPKSSCGICGSILGNATCRMGVLPSNPADAKYYVPVEKKIVEQYGVVVEKTYTTDDGYGGGWWNTNKYDTLIMFDTEEQLKSWYRENLEKTSKLPVKKIIKFTELKASTEVVIKLA